MAKAEKTKATTAARPSLKLTEFQAGTIKGAVKATGAIARQLYMVPIEAIQIAPGFNLRVTDSAEYKAEIEALKQSMLTEGFYATKPLSGFASLDEQGDDCIIVTDGHRRLEAARLAAAEDETDRFERLPVVLKPATASNLDLAVSLHKENDAKPLSMLERAVLVRRMLSSGLGEREVASRLGITDRYVSDLKLLVGAPKAVRALVSAGKIAGTEAVTQLRKNPDAAAEKLQTLAAKAEKAGQPRLTGNRIKNEAETPKVKMTTTTVGFTLRAGELAALEEVEPFFALFEDLDWYEHTSRPNEIRALEDVSVEARVRRPKKDVPKEAVSNGATDDFTNEDEGDDDAATDLRGAGIADPAGDPAHGL